MNTDRPQKRTYQGRTTLIDPVGDGWYSVILSFGPLGPAEHQKMCWSITAAETFVRQHGWPMPADELVVA